LFAYEEKDGKVKLGEGERFPNPNSISGYLTKDIALSKVKKIREKTKNRDGISYLEKKNNELQEKVIQLETKLNHYQSQIEV
jgi:hypothetical protein